jgi:hypothetical protein
MSQIELLRHQVHGLVDQIDDEQLLDLLHQTAIDGISLEQDNHQWDDLSEHTKAAILQSLEEMKAGKFLTHEEVMKKHAPWRIPNAIYIHRVIDTRRNPS